MPQNSPTSNEGSRSHRPPAPPPPPGRHPKIRKVPELFLGEEQSNSEYIPKVVSIGPYHHGKPELGVAESFKPTFLNLIVKGNKIEEDKYYQEIKKNVINIRNCYEKNPTDSYSDDELVRMMLLDACFIVIYMETTYIQGHPLSDHEKMIYRDASIMVHVLGISAMPTILRDMFLLENQIPLWIIKLLLKSRYEGNKSGEFLNRFLTRSLFGEFQSKRKLPPENQEELHLLDAFHRLVVFGFVGQPKKNCLNFCKFPCCCRVKQEIVGDSNTDLESGVPSQDKSKWKRLKKHKEGDYAKGNLMKFTNLFYSVTYLKAAGIRFKPNQTLSLKDVKFESNCIFGRLQLPGWCVSTHTKGFFMNMIAYEWGTNNPTKAVVTAYINLMKSLVMRPEDVKELRANKILFGMLGTDEEILKVYQDINTHGMDNSWIFDKAMKQKIQAHCDSKAKVLIAELVNTNFRNPWTFIALLAATYLLVLATLQTIYTIKPN